VRIHRFDTASLAAAPWKNGGGTTREIAAWPEGAGMDGFDWRVSIATIDQAGPFSAFSGVDRVIMLLDGSGVRLRSGDGRIDHRLDRPQAPFAFAGDMALDCELLGGRSTDFNVMTRRGRVRAEVRVLTGDSQVEPAAAGLLLALRGRWQLRGGDTTTLEAGAGFWWAEGPTGWRATSVDAEAALVAVRFETLTPSTRTP
jgi:environmental stress-induced protein Ves